MRHLSTRRASSRRIWPPYPCLLWGCGRDNCRSGGGGAHTGEPGLGPCLRLGAALSPIEPIAVTAIASRLGAPRRVLAVLEGESLINDGTALVFYSAAVQVVVSRHFSWRAITLEFPTTGCGGITIDRAFDSLVHVMGAHAAARKRLSHHRARFSMRLFDISVRRIAARI